MAHIRKRGKGWYVEIDKKGVCKHATFDSKTEAARWAAETEALIVAGKDTSIPDITFGQLLDKYSKEVSPKKRGSRWEEIRIELIKRDELAGVKLAALDERNFADWRDRRLESVSAASVRREWNILSAACSIALKEWKWLERHPMKAVKRPAPPEARDRRISDREIETLLYTLGYDGNTPSTITARVGAAFLFALETAMRAGEIAALTWDRVNLEKRYLTIQTGKTASAKRHVPLSTEAIRILNQMGTEGSVFGLTTQQIDALFRKAKAKALIEDLHFHDSRAEAITRLAARLDILTLARMVGHKDLKMLTIYYRESAEDIAKKLK
jgi:integrase